MTAMRPSLLAKPHTAVTGKSVSKSAVIACGALVRELRAIGVNATYLPAPLHSRPERIPDAVEAGVRQLLKDAQSEDHVLETVVLGYGDCGTGGLLDLRIAALESELGVKIERLPGDHCYSFFAGSTAFAALHEEELGTFFLTDFLAQHFDQLVWGPLGLRDHPQLLDMYFGNYSRVVYLVQTSDPSRAASLITAAKQAAEKLGLAFEIRHTGLDPLRSALACGSVSTPVTLSTTLGPTSSKIDSE